MKDPYFTIYTNAHTLIAGTTGSGKSYLLHKFIDNGIQNFSPDQLQFIFIDPKQCELNEYKKNPFCLGYFTKHNEIENALQIIVKIVNNRFSEMQRRGEKHSSKYHIFVIIDEFVDIRLFCPAAVKNINYLSSIARAANVHLILCTQRPTRDIIPPLLSANFPCKIGLRTATPQESRNIIQINGCEKLPQFGYAFVTSPDRLTPEKIKIE